MLQFSSKDQFGALPAWQRDGYLWNAMIHPLLKMSIYGVIWYQGQKAISH